MSKYDQLGDYLKNQRADRVPMSFADIERVIRGKLPASAHKHRPWWSNNASNSVITKVWLEAGFESEQVDMARRKLVFRRVRTPPSRGPTGQATGQRIHPAFGALKGMVRIMPGTDLTKPADPDWGQIADELE
jgi:hypothetical protein